MAAVTQLLSEIEAGDPNFAAELYRRTVAAARLWELPGGELLGEAEATSRLRFDPADAAFLIDALPGCPARPTMVLPSASS
jgi:hypothetical protein